MGERNTLRNIVTILGFLAGLVIAFFVKGRVPEAAKNWSGFLFFGTLILVGGAVGLLAAKFIHR